MDWYVYVLVWVLSALFSYPGIKYVFVTEKEKKNGNWKQGDRAGLMFFCLLMAPAALLGAVFGITFKLLAHLIDNDFWNRPASW